MQRMDEARMTYTQAPKWTPAEIQILRDNYPHKSRKEMMALLPNRSDFSIGSKAQDMGLKCLIKTVNNTKRPEWSEWEKFHLKSVYATHTIYQLMEIFPNRSRQAIEQRAHAMCLAKNPDVLAKTRLEVGKKTQARQRMKQFEETEEAGTTVVIVKPAPERDSMVRRAIAFRTPLEQAWGGQ